MAGRLTAWLTAMAVVAGALWPLPYQRAEAADGDLARGNYLIDGPGACGNCHSPRGPDREILAGKELSGGRVFDEAAFRAVAPNITPDRETGIGGWSDVHIIAAIREGKRPDGSIIGPPMPIAFYRSMSDTDVRAMVAALRATPAVRNKVEKSTYKMTLPLSYGPPVAHVADVPRQDRVAYGHYLADIAHCMLCHTPMVKGQLDMSRVGGGGRELSSIPSGVVVSANLTPGNPDGMAHWTDAQVKETISNGVRPDGRRLVPVMAFAWYKSITDDDLDALVAYLRTLKPVKN